MKTGTIFLACLLPALVICDDYYKLLGVERDADAREIRRAFKKIALTMHPDKNHGDPGAHDKFVKINKAYEVLKDPDVRKRYDTYGEEGLDKDQTSWGRQYHSWNYYHEKFGIYDDDLEIVTLSRNDFQSSVLDSADIWFVNYYSPQCSHCHHLAPNWRALAQSFEGVIRIGAVNCEEDWQLCRQEGIQAFPTLLFYPDREKYTGHRGLEDLKAAVLKRLPDLHVDIADTGLLEPEARSLLRSVVVLACESSGNCLPPDEVKKLAVATDGLAHVSSVDCEKEPSTCKKAGVKDGAYFFESIAGKTKPPVKIGGSDAVELRKAVLRELPGFETITLQKFDKLMAELSSNDEAEPWFLHFGNSDQSEGSLELELKHIRGYVQSVRLGYVDCSSERDVCRRLSVSKTPLFLVLRPGAEYEVYHGRTNARDLASFLRESVGGRLETLTASTFTAKVTRGGSPWLVDFFAPWCPPCMRTLPELRKTSRSFDAVRFGTVDCTVHASVCKDNMVGSYPTLVLFHNGTTTILSGFKTALEIREFVEIALDPKVVFLTPDSFEELVERKKEDDVWAVDFFAPWCGHCRQLAPEWNKFAKMVADDPNLHVGQVDCAAHRDFCAKQGVRSYPTLRAYPRGPFNARHISTFDGWSRDAASFREWATRFLPSSVEELDHSDFFGSVLTDREPWVVDFYAPWCGHCVAFRPVVEAVAKKMEGKVKFGAVNCEEHWQACDAAEVHRYPTVVFYGGAVGGKAQGPRGAVVQGGREAVLLEAVERMLKPRSRSKRVGDEL